MALVVLLVLFVIMLVIGVPIGIAIGGSAVAAILSADLPGILLPQRTFVMLDSFSLMAVPIYILAGELMSAAGITKRIVNFATSLVGHLRAGLGQASIVSAMLLSGITGSGIADASALGSFLIPAMRNDGYDDDFSVSIIASATTVGPIIPPSIMMIIYGAMTGASIGAMFVGGIVPGILFGLALMALTNFISRKRNYPVHPKATLKEILKTFKEAVWALIMPLIIIGGMMSGYFTATESGIIGIVYALILGFANGSIKLKDVKGILVTSAKGTATPMFLIGIASVFGWFLARYNFPDMVGDLLRSITSSPAIFMVIVWAVYLVVGCFMEDTAAMIILVPVLAPLAAEFGISGIQFGVFTVVTLIIGAITPPVGMLIFVCSAIAKINVSKVYKTIIPFACVLAFIALLIGLIPPLVTWLPGVLFK